MPRVRVQVEQQEIAVKIRTDATANQSAQGTRKLQADFEEATTRARAELSLEPFRKLRKKASAKPPRPGKPTFSTVKPMLHGFLDAAWKIQEARYDSIAKIFYRSLQQKVQSTKKLLSYAEKVRGEGDDIVKMCAAKASEQTKKEFQLKWQAELNEIRRLLRLSKDDTSSVDELQKLAIERALGATGQSLESLQQTVEGGVLAKLAESVNAELDVARQTWKLTQRRQKLVFDGKLGAEIDQIDSQIASLKTKVVQSDSSDSEGEFEPNGLSMYRKAYTHMLEQLSMIRVEHECSVAALQKLREKLAEEVQLGVEKAIGQARAKITLDEQSEVANAAAELKSFILDLTKKKEQIEKEIRAACTQTEFDSCSQLLRTMELTIDMALDSVREYSYEAAIHSCLPN